MGRRVGGIVALHAQRTLHARGILDSSPYGFHTHLLSYGLGRHSHNERAYRPSIDHPHRVGHRAVEAYLSCQLRRHDLGPWEDVMNSDRHTDPIRSDSVLAQMLASWRWG